MQQFVLEEHLEIMHSEVGEEKWKIFFVGTRRIYFCYVAYSCCKLQSKMETDDKNRENGKIGSCPIDLCPIN